MLLFFVCVSEFSIQIFWGCLSFPDLEGSAFSRFGVSWVPEVVSHMRRGASHVDHFLRLDQNWNCARKASGTQSRLGGGGCVSRSEFSRFVGTEFWGLRSEGLSFLDTHNGQM